LVVKYKIQLSKYDGSIYWPLGYPWLSWVLPINISDLLVSVTDKVNPWPKRVDIVLRNSRFIGSCVVIKDSSSSTEGNGMWFWFAMNNYITINRSRCSTAFSIFDSDVNGADVQLSDLTISNSHSNILLVNLASERLRLILTGNTSFLSNQGSVIILSGSVEFKGFVLISDNTAHKHESIVQVSDLSKVYFDGEIMFINNTGRQGGAISAYSSSLYFDGNMSFIGNQADNGGAISLKEGAVINLEAGIQITFQGNIADMYGGAIYVEDTAFWARRRIKCFVSSTNGYIEFENNTAGVAGADLFGGWIDLCGTRNGTKPSNIFDFEENGVASKPTGVGICTNSILNKHETEIHINIFPGQSFEIEVVAVGQRFGMTPASVRAETSTDNVIDQLQKLQDTENHCTALKFTVKSSNRNETMLLNVDGRTLPKWINESTPDELRQLKMFIMLKDCPLGFEFDSRQNICSCHSYLDAYGVQCDFTTYKINRHAQQWIGVLNHPKIFIIHQHCPYDYCKPYALLLNLSVPDDQCSSYRSGILCGACQPGLSQVLGTSNCKRCSNVWLLLIVIFALAGILLVAGLLILNITVSSGTINGLIFYANIVRANTATFFPDKTANTFLSWFIAWLNLDVGIETCFYDGLDAYTKTWLQFLFPLYIWFLIMIIIISSKYSKRAAGIIGVNAVQVLATLFLLSYAKLLRLTITVFQSTHLRDNHNVWHYDGNIAYLGNWHAPLMLVALLFFAFFLLPYTLTIFSIQWLQKFSHYKPFHWVNKLKPFFDAYTGPYKDKHRYWTGLLLLVRIVLFIVYSTNTSGDPAINIFASIVVVMCLFAYLAFLVELTRTCY
jgi:predicted outer membrane repeat protein